MPIRQVLGILAVLTEKMAKKATVKTDKDKIKTIRMDSRAIRTDKTDKTALRMDSRAIKTGRTDKTDSRALRADKTGKDKMGKMARINPGTARKATNKDATLEAIT